MAIEQLIAMGGTQIKSPVQRYLETKSQIAQEERNRLADAATRQSMGIQQQQNVRAQQEHETQQFQNYGKSVAPIFEWVESQQDKQAAFAQAFPQMKSIASQMNIDTSDWTPEYDPAESNAIISQFGKPKKPPKTREIKSGKEYVTQEWDANSGQWVEVSRGPRREEQVTGPPGAYDKTGPQRGKEQIEFEDMGVNALNLMDTADDAINIIRTAPQAAGLTGNILSGLNTVSQTMSGLLSTARKDLTGNTFDLVKNGKSKEVSVAELPEIYSDELSAFRGSAIYSQELEGMLTNMAYAAAGMKGQTGRGLSDIDLKLNMQEVGKATDPIAVERLIRNFMKRAVKGMENKAKIKGRENDPVLQTVLDRFRDFSKDKKQKSAQKVVLPEGWSVEEL